MNSLKHKTYIWNMETDGGHNVSKTSHGWWWWC